MMNYCVECGTKLELKEHKTEGVTPWCPACQAFRYPIYNTAVSMIVIDEANGKILLIKQYGRPFYVLVAGYITRGESAEDAVKREVLEETGLHVARCEFNKSRFFEPSNTLMINFAAFVDSDAVNINYEVDSYQWFSFENAKKNIKPGSLAEEFLLNYLSKL